LKSRRREEGAALLFQTRNKNDKRARHNFKFEIFRLPPPKRSGVKPEYSYLSLVLFFGRSIFDLNHNGGAGQQYVLATSITIPSTAVAG